MKKILFSFLIVFALGFNAFAQNAFAPKSDLKIQNESVLKNRHQNILNKKAYTSGWYSYTDMVSKGSNISSQLNKNSVGYMGVDTIVKNVFSDGTIGHNFWFGFGQILDPTDDLIENTDNPGLKLSRFNSYYFDSISFPYCYNRLVDSFMYTPGVNSVVHDTLFIAYFKGSSIVQTNWTAAPKDKVSLLPYNNAKLAPSGFFAMDTIILTSGINGMLDSTSIYNVSGGYENSVGIKIAQFAAPANTKITLASNGTTKDRLVGVAFKFATGVPPIVGTDTAVRFYSMDPATKPLNMRRTNSFAFNYIQNQLETPRFSNPYFYNMSELQPAWAAYGQSTNWKDNYVAGTGFAKEIFVEVDFFLTNKDGIPAGVNENSNNLSISSIYPNPTTGRTVVSFETKVASEVKAEIYNLMGQNVKTMNLGKTTAGSYEFPLDLSNLNPGVYMVTVSAGNSKQTQKLVIAE